MPSSVTWRSTCDAQRDEDAELDAGGRMVRGVTVKWKRAPSMTPAGTGHLQLVAQQLGAAAVAAAARLGPRLAAAAAVAAGAADRNLERHRGARRAPRAARAESRRSARRRARRRGTRWRMRSTAGATDGKSMTTSSAKQLASWRLSSPPMTAT